MRSRRTPVNFTWSRWKNEPPYELAVAPARSGSFTVSLKEKGRKKWQTNTWVLGLDPSKLAKPI